MCDFTEPKVMLEKVRELYGIPDMEYIGVFDRYGIFNGVDFIGLAGLYYVPGSGSYYSYFDGKYWLNAYRKDYK